MDEDPDAVRRFRERHPADADAPLAFLFAVMPGTRLRVRSLAGQWAIVTLQPGELLVFRSDRVLHNGLGYPSDNYRIHGHIWPASYKAPESALYSPPAATEARRVVGGF